VKEASVKKGDFFVNQNAPIPSKSLMKALGKPVVKPPQTITKGLVTPGEPKKAHFFGCK
jgi:hypothetical protein